MVRCLARGKASSLMGTRIRRIERILRIARLRGERPGARFRDRWVFVNNNKTCCLSARSDAGAPFPAAGAEQSVKSARSV